MSQQNQIFLAAASCVESEWDRKLEFSTDTANSWQNSNRQQQTTNRKARLLKIL